ncbi:MAG: hypothetical protein KGL53_09970 [Elusimicrobia bacterium]|nr:hypothetical protein [Elusimicrobiota bacterium]
MQNSIDAAFLAELRAATERRWAEAEPDPRVSGFQFARGTRWLPGLSEEGLRDLEEAYGLRLPDDARLFYSVLDGTEPDAVNLYAGRQSPARRPGVYSFPRDVKTVRAIIAEWDELHADIAACLSDEGLELGGEARLLPLYGHRALVCGGPGEGTVASIQPGDSVVYAPDLRGWLTWELLRG